MSTSIEFWELTREAARDVAHRAEAGIDSARAAVAARDVGTIEYATESSHAMRTIDVVRAASSVAFVKELAKICGKAGAAGAAVDGAIGGFRAAQYVRQGAIDKQQALKHVGAEAGCGFVTSSSGTAGTLAVFMVTGSMGPAALAAGMGASMGSRYLYKQAVGETLPDEEELEEMRRGEEAPRGTDGTATPHGERSAASGMEDIGPGAEASDEGSGFEGIGPNGDAPAESSGPNGVEPDVSPENPEASDDGDDGDEDDGVMESIGPDGA